MVIGFIVGIAIGQSTFYSLYLDNLKHLGALKAMGIQFPAVCNASGAIMVLD